MALLEVEHRWGWVLVSEESCHSYHVLYLLVADQDVSSHLLLQPPPTRSSHCHYKLRPSGTVSPMKEVVLRIALVRTNFHELSFDLHI